MTLVLDEFLRALRGPARDAWAARIAKSTIVRADNVAEYLRDDPKDHAEAMDFPNVAPPWSQFWIEYHLSSLLGEEPSGSPLDSLGIAGVSARTDDGGWRLECITVSPGRLFAGGVILVTPEGRVNGVRKIGGPALEDACSAWLLLRDAEKVRDVLCDAKSSGEVDWRLARYMARGHTRDEALERVAGDLEEEMRALPRDFILSDRTFDMWKHWCLPVLGFTFSFANCRNVARDLNSMPPKVAKKRARKGLPVFRYYTLRISKVMGASKQSAPGDPDAIPPGRPLHIVRGHFKTYTAEKPLLGHAVGTFWWADSARGKAEHGKVTKEYEVAAPPTTAPRPAGGGAGAGA